jgi:hypothetical protein
MSAIDRSVVRHVADLARRFEIADRRVLTLDPPPTPEQLSLAM